MRMKPALKVLSAVCLIVLLAAPLAAREDAAPGAAKYKLKKVGLPGFEGHVYAQAWAAVDNINSIVFVSENIEGPSGDENFLRSFTLKRNGKAGKANTLLVLNTGYVSQAAAFWFEGAAPTSGHGLLVAAISPEGVYNVCWVATALFDSSGKLTSELNVIHEFAAPGEAYIAGRWLGARRVGNTVGVAASVDHSLNTEPFYGDISTAAIFMEVSNVGNLISPAVAAVNLPKDGNLQQLRVFTPAWNGVSWMVPAVVTLLREDTYEGRGYTEEVGYQLVVIAATPTGTVRAIKTRFRRIARDNTEIHWPTYVSPVFLPRNGAASPAVGESMNLLYVKAVPAGGGVNAAEYTCYIQGVNGKARRDGKRIEVGVGPWQRQFESVQGLSSEDTECYFSNAFDAGDGKLFIAHARTASFYQAATQGSQREMQLDLYKLDPADGGVEVMAQTSRKGTMLRSPAALRFFGSLLRSLVYCVGDTGSNYEQFFYFSKLKAK